MSLFVISCHSAWVTRAFCSSVNSAVRDLSQALRSELISDPLDDTDHRPPSILQMLLQSQLKEEKLDCNNA